MAAAPEDAAAVPRLGGDVSAATLAFEDRKGKVALVFGGTGAIGAAICRLLAAEGADVAFTCRANRAGAEALASELEGAGGRVVWGAVANEDAQAVAAFIERVAENLGRIDAVIYAAGPDIPLSFVGKIDPAEWARVMDADINGCFHLARAALRHLRASKGSFTAVLTAALARPPALDGLSSVPKAAIEAMVKTLAQEEGRYGLRANCVAPGFVDGGLGRKLLDHLGGNAQAGIVARTDLRRLGRAEEIADAVGFLSSARASFITGETLFVSGGLRA